MILSLRWKIALNMWLLAALSTAVAGFAGCWLLIKNEQGLIEHRLSSTAATLMSLGISDYHGLQGFEKLADFIDDALHTEEEDQIINVFTRRGKLMFHSAGGNNEDFRSAFHPPHKPVFTTWTGKRKYKILTSPYTAKTGKEYFLQIALPAPHYPEIVASMVNEALVLFLILSLIAFALSHLFANKLTAPIRAIAVYLGRWNPADREWIPLDLPRAGEYLQAIVTGINALTIRVKGSIYGLSRTSRFLAHELRNPLTILAGEAENALRNPAADAHVYQAVLKSSLEEIERMNGVITTVLGIFEKEKASYRPLVHNLSEWLEAQLPRWRETLGRDIAWHRSPHAVRTMFDPDLLFRLLDNLMRNIRKHAGSALASMHLTMDHGQLTIVVADTGPGMSPSLIAALNKGDRSGSGIGIGLILCLDIADACRFQLSFANQPSGGVAVTIRLP